MAYDLAQPLNLPALDTDLKDMKADIRPPAWLLPATCTTAHLGCQVPTGSSTSGHFNQTVSSLDLGHVPTVQ